ncbi:MAG: OmpA family protein [Weeksellaceae bacterium]|nr:OmpA family protein [Weeksellaceae bacterium]
MKKLNSKIGVILVTAGLLLSSCDANNTQKGVAIGAAAGAIIGGVLGNNVGSKDNAAAGAIAGAVIGGAAGGIIGHKMDKQAKQIENTLPGAEVVRSAEGIQVILDENSNVRFEYNKASLTADAKSNLQKLIPIFNEYPDTDLLIIGHTDSIGSQEYNLPLSEKRAGSVVDYLKSQGIASSRLSHIGRGKLEPRADNATEAGRAQNRRVEFVITANEKMKAEAEQEAGN